MPSRLGPIILAQWRTIWNYRPAGGRGGRIAGAIVWLLWYGLWALFAYAAAFYTHYEERSVLAGKLPWALMGLAVFWQMSPVLTANLGAGIEYKKLRIYPIPEGELFLLSLLLRLVSASELLLVLAGMTIGLLLNPTIPRWAPVPALALFAAFNVFLAAGLRSLLERLLAIRRIREIVVLLAILCAALPQLLAYTGVPAGVKRFFAQGRSAAFPWTGAGLLATGERALAPLAALAAWTAGAFAFGLWQFRRSLAFDAEAARARRSDGRAGPRAGSLYRLPALLLRDPLAAMVEKELRSLARSPRFRIVFLMGFSFGMAIWWPLFHSAEAPVSYPVAVSAYALVLLAEVAFWNQFGFDRAAVQTYFMAPVPFSAVLRAKNVAAFWFVIFEVTAVLLVSAPLGVPLSADVVLEAYAVTLTLALYFLAAGNLSSVNYPRPVDPEHSWGRTSAGRFQVYMLLLFPLFAAPVALAYLAGYAFDSRAAFYAVLAFDALAGIAAYRIATASAAAAGPVKRERFIQTLSGSGGPIAAG
ncbi:MAG: hypothetical protein ACM336_11750 [Acidobacteriota bacterium]